VFSLLVHPSAPRYRCVQVELNTSRCTVPDWLYLGPGHGVGGVRLQQNVQGAGLGLEAGELDVTRGVGEDAVRHCPRPTGRRDLPHTGFLAHAHLIMKYKVDNFFCGLVCVGPLATPLLLSPILYF
jgi:hypothetical protein